MKDQSTKLAINGGPKTKAAPGSASDTGIAAIAIRLERSQDINVPARPRNHFAPIELHTDIDTVRVVVTTADPRATWTVGQTPLASGEDSAPISLQVGRNLIHIIVTAHDGRTTLACVVKVFRAHATPRWNRVAKQSPWAPRDTAGELVFNGRMWLFGGFTPELASDVWCSADGKTWTQTGTVPSTQGIDIPVAVVFDNKMWVSDVAGVFFSSSDGAKWSVVTDQAPWKGRSGAGAVVFADKMWVMGGRKDGEVFNDIWSSADGVHWRMEVEHAPWSARQIHHTPLVLDNKIWLLGGGVIGSAYHPFVAYNDVWNSPDGRNWELATRHAPWPPRIWGSSAVYRDRLWVIGGYRSEPVDQNLADVWYSANGADWHCLEALLTWRHPSESVRGDAMWKARHEMSVYTFVDSLWLAGGMEWPLMNDVWQLTIPGLCFTTRPVLESYVGALYEYRVHADFNRSRQAIRYRLIEGPAWLRLDSATGVLLGTPPAVADAHIVLEASDNAGETARQAYTLHAIPLI